MRRWGMKDRIKGNLGSEGEEESVKETEDQGRLG